MDNKNVFIAIALSMSVLLFWAAFFETPRQANTNKNLPQNEQIKPSENNITPNIDATIKVKTISKNTP